jgi:hypothetical protein
MNDRVLAVIGPVLVALGAERNPECWVAWGEDPDIRYSLLAPTLAGVITLAVRFTNPEDGPRVIAKLVRWSKVAVSELSLDAGSGHRMVAVQVESLVLKGLDEEADRVCEFVRMLIAGVEDRLHSPVPMAAARGVAPVVEAPSAAVAPKPGVGKVTPARVPVVASPQSAETAVVQASGAPAAGKSGDGKLPASKTPKTPKVEKTTAPDVATSKTAPAAATTGHKSDRKAPPKASPKPSGLVLVPPSPAANAAASGPEAPAEFATSTEQVGTPTPIAARTARHAAGDVEPVVTPNHPDAEPERELDRSGWVSPHPISEQPARKPAKPRTWMP